MIFTLIICIAVAGAAQTKKTVINGSVVDRKNMPIQSATVSLLRYVDSSIIKIAVSDNTGNFSFTGIPYGKYFISVSSINYHSAFSIPFTLAEDTFTCKLNAVVLENMANSLNDVVVTSKKPLIEQRIDKLIVNIDASVTNVGATALEILEKSPGISVDKDGNIILKGKNAVLVMIDGKPSYLNGADLSNLLANMNSNQLSQIEIMTNPSAKYDASGNAGVINIKTKKNLANGFNGNLTLNYGQGLYAKTNNSIMLNYRTNKFNAFLNYGYTLNKSFLNVDVVRNFVNLNGAKSYELNQYTNVINQSKNNNLKLGLDYFINPKTTIGLMVSGFLAPQNQNPYTTSVIADSIGNVSTIQKTIKTADNTWKNGTVNISFNKKFENSNKNLSGNFDYMNYHFDGNQNLAGSVYDANKQLQSISYLSNILPLGINIYAARMDYTQSLNDGLKIETGFKISLVKTNNTSLFYTIANNQQLFQDSISSAFNYRENINAGYINLNKKLGDLTIQAGLRVENTNYNGLQKSYIHQQDSTFDRTYTGLFPSLFVSYQLNDNNTFALSVGKRIDRPAYQQLNPFISFVDKYMRMAGNPYLQPQISKNIELNYTYKNIFTTTLNYSVIDNMINETMIQNDSLTTRSVGNIGTRYNFGISESATIPFTKWYTGVIYANLYENKYNGLINGYPLNAEQLTLAMNINNQFTFQRGWSAELSGTYTTKSRDEGQAIVLPIGQISAGFSKQILNNKASIKLNIRDIFYSQISREIQNFQNVQSTLQLNRDTRVINIAFVYRFGIQSKVKSNQQIEEQKRIQMN